MMRWFRIRRWYTAYAALFSLALQFGVSFAHVHLGPIEPASALAATSIPSSEADGKRAPFDSGSHDHAGVCDICAALNLLGAGQTPIAPALPVRLGFVVVSASFPSAPGPAQQYSVLFRSRAPPIA